jgi:TOBE domain
VHQSDAGEGLTGTVVTAAFQGSVIRVKVRLDRTDTLIDADAPADSISQPNAGDRVTVTVVAQRAFIEAPKVAATVAV